MKNKTRQYFVVIEMIKSEYILCKSKTDISGATGYHRNNFTNLEEKKVIGNYLIVPVLA
jgi:hypothetical protein